MSAEWRLGPAKSRELWCHGCCRKRVSGVGCPNSKPKGTDTVPSGSYYECSISFLQNLFEYRGPCISSIGALVSEMIVRGGVMMMVAAREVVLILVTVIISLNPKPETLI